MARALVLLLAVVAVVAVAYGSVGRRGGDATPTVVATQPAAAQGGQTPAGETPVSQPAETPVTSSAPLTPEQLQQYKPNELGQIPILEYHQIGPNPEQFVRTPDQMRGDLQWLYDHGFYVINISEILADRIDVPLGKKPVVLTFDDSPAGQFRLLRLDTASPRSIRTAPSASWRRSSPPTPTSAVAACSSSCRTWCSTGRRSQQSRISRASTR